MLATLPFVAPERAVAQEEAAPSEPISYGLGIKLSVPQGLTVEAGAKFMPELSVRAGLSFLPGINVLNKSEVMAVSIEKFPKTDVLVDMTGKISSLSGHVLLDYHPFRNGFRITAGLYIGGGKARLHGLFKEKTTGQPLLTYAKNLTSGTSGIPGAAELLKDPTVYFDLTDENDKVVENGHIGMKLSDDSSMEITSAYKHVVQPYFGLGYGYAVPKSRVGFTADLGVMYTGGTVMKSPNLVSGDLNAVWEMNSALKSLRKITNFSPVLNIGMTIRLN